MINGIKPDISKKTLLNSKTEFGEAMDKFLNKLTENAKPYVERFNHMKNVTFKVDGGRKFLKIKYFTDRIDTNYDDNGKATKTIHKDTKGSIHCFVDKNTGDIYKAATWKAPYTKGKNPVRGSIYDEKCYEKTDLYGGWLYAK
tara:strand:- start:217 stop:645 length:429 start_codon:yes stop_codon:yes gene_type:complete